MEFIKYEATGNDFVLIDSLGGKITLSSGQVRNICNRHTGVGADGILMLLPSDTADVRMRIFNADGSEAEMCGNGARAVALHVYSFKSSHADEIGIETMTGIRKAKISEDGFVTIEMGSASLKRADIPMKGEPDEEALDVPIEIDSSKNIVATCVSMGNPHCVVFIDGVDEYPVETIGPEIENNQLFFNKTNVEFIEITDSGSLKLRVWERGVGETLACGTGTCAAAVAAHRKGLTGSVVTVRTRGGELKVDCSFNDIELTGSARMVFRGIIED